MSTWQEYIQSLQEANSYRNRVKPGRLKSDMEHYGVGGSKGSSKAQKGSPYKNVKVSFKGKGFNDISAPLEEEVEESSFAENETLEPRLWKAKVLDPVAAENLLKIAQDFIDSLPVEVNIEDITLTGSLANYNWSNYSDIDLHIIVDFLNIDENMQLVRSFFDNARMRWNDKHEIQLKGYDVEIYVEHAGEQHVSSGIYSILHDEWVVEPEIKQSKIDFSRARRKADDLEFQVNIVNNLVNARKFKSALKNIERLKAKIKNMRRAGLESPKAEFSIENIAFKILRRNEILKQLSDLKTKAYDDMMSLNGE